MSTEIGRILTFEPARAKSNPVLILAASFSALYFVLIGAYIGRYAEEITSVAADIAQGIQGGGGNVEIVQWVQEVTDPAIRSLFRDHSPLLAIFFWLAIIATPWLAMLIASDQTASELGRRHIRFVLPRARRRSLYLARALAAWLSWVVVSSTAVLLVTMALTVLGPKEELGANLILAQRILGVLAIYGLPFIAMMAFINTFIPNGFLSYLLATGVWIVVAVFGAVGGWIDEAYSRIHYLMPTILKYPLMSDEGGRFASGAGGALAYTAVFLLLGDWIFRSRDV